MRGAAWAATGAGPRRPSAIKASVLAYLMSLCLIACCSLLGTADTIPARASLLAHVRSMTATWREVAPGWRAAGPVGEAAHMRVLTLRMGPYPAPAVAAALALVLGCVGGGVLLASLLGGSRATSSDAAGSGKREIAGPLRLQVPEGWSRVAEARALPGFTTPGIAARQAETRMDLVAALLPADHASLLPAALVERLATSRPSPIAIPVVGGQLAYQYVALRVRGVPGVLDVLAWPTTRGVATVACLAAPAFAPLLASCDDVARTVSVAGAHGLPLGPATALLSRLPPVLASVDAARSAYARATTRGDAGAASRLAAAHRRAAGALSSVMAAGRRPIERALRAEGLAYARLAEALRTRDRSAAIRARGRIEAGERRLQRELDAVAGGYQR